MNTGIKGPKTLIEAVEYFSNPDNAHAFMLTIRWPGGEVCCPNCGSVRVRYIQTRRQWECRESHPKKRFSLKTGTIMEESPLPLKKWLACLWMEVNCKNSISSYEIARDLGVTQKTGWFMLHRIRFALKEGSFDKLGGNGAVVEADETGIGGKATNMHKDKRAAAIQGGGLSTKTIVLGLLERHGRHNPISQVRTQVVPDVKRNTLHDVIHKNVEAGSHVVTDSWNAYRELHPDYIHGWVNHMERYVDGIVHTNGLENFWSLFKRCIKGTHVSVEPFHLAAYADSEAFRFNYRDVKDGDRFKLGMKGINGKRLTYKELTANSLEARASSENSGAESAPN